MCRVAWEGHESMSCLVANGWIPRIWNCFAFFDTHCYFWEPPCACEVLLFSSYMFIGLLPKKGWRFVLIALLSDAHFHLLQRPNLVTIILYSLSLLMARRKGVVCLLFGIISFLILPPLTTGGFRLHNLPTPGQIPGPKIVCRQLNIDEVLGFVCS